MFDSFFAKVFASFAKTPVFFAKVLRVGFGASSVILRLVIPNYIV